VIVRPELPRDRPSAFEAERLAFQAARGGEPADDIISGIGAVQDMDGSFALVAEIDGEVVGHVQFSRAWIGETPALLLGPIGVHPEAQRRGIGSTLVRAGLDEARARNEAAVILLGDPRFYSRFGFVSGSTVGLRNPAVGVQPNGFVISEGHFMIALLEGCAEALVGRVRWDPAL